MYVWKINSLVLRQSIYTYHSHHDLIIPIVWPGNAVLEEAYSAVDNVLLFVAENTALSSVDPAVLKEAYSSVATLLLEAVKTDQSVDSLRLVP